MHKGEDMKRSVSCIADVVGGICSRSGFHVFMALAALLAIQSFQPGSSQAQEFRRGEEFTIGLIALKGPPRERLSLNADWKFTKGDPEDAKDKLAYAKIKDWITQTGNSFLKESKESVKPEGEPGADVSYIKPDFDDSTWRTLRLPHDWGIEGPFKQEYPSDTGKLPWWGVGWYRKHFHIPAEDQGQRIFLDIDGAMAYATVWLNGHFLGGWPYGYSSFQLELTPYIKYGGENVLAIRLDNPKRSSRWYPGGGIYRNVWLTKTSPIHIGQWGTYITTPKVTKDSATIEIQATIDNQSTADSIVNVNTLIYELNSSGRKIASKGITEPVSVTIPAGKSVACQMEIKVDNPKLWDLKNPQLYAAVTIINLERGKTSDAYETIFGIRTIKFDADKGFILNGQHVHLNGVCDHHDLGALGTAINTRALQRQIELLQEMGCNAIRTSHNPPAPELLDLCDRMGMVVMDEAFDTWARTKNPNDYGRLFKDWHEKDLRALVRRDRNHPCVIIWSTGNEIGEQDMRGNGRQISEELTRIVHEEDPTRLVVANCNNAQAGFNGFQKTLDVMGFSYKPYLYGRFHKENPAMPEVGSETASCISSRGEYFFPVSNNKDNGKADFQMSSYDLYAPPWATIPDTEFKGQDENPFNAGEFVWTGFDYLGEPTPYNRDTSNLLNFTDPEEKAKMAKELESLGKIKVPSRSSYFGIIDLAGFKKDRFYIYQARWRPDLPMVHILPHWNWPERVGEVTPVHVYTSGDEVELLLNGKSLGRKKKGQYEYRLRWDEVKYEPGELKAVAYKDGKLWAEAVTKTTGPAAKLSLQPDRSEIQADGADLSYVTVSVVDKDGLVVPRSKNRIKFQIEGPGEIVAVDNGDPTCLESFQSKEYNAFNGLCLVIVRAKKAAISGSITLKAESDGLEGAKIGIFTNPGNYPVGAPDLVPTKLPLPIRPR
jgi:beta-galactosidase